MATREAVTVAEDRSRGTLRRELRFWEAIAISIGIMAPTAAMALNGTAPAGLVGRAVPLAFLFAAIAVGLIAYSFVRLTSFFNHAGSAYASRGRRLARAPASSPVGRCLPRTASSSPPTLPKSGCSARRFCPVQASGRTRLGSSCR